MVPRDDESDPDGVSVDRSLDQALSLGRAQAEGIGVDEVMVIGGGQIYADSVVVADRIYLTEIHLNVDGDTAFPELPAGQWREVSRETHPKNAEGDPAYSFVILDRTNE